MIALSAGEGGEYDIPKYDAFGRSILTILFGPESRWPCYVTGKREHPDALVPMVAGSCTQQVYRVFVDSGGRSTAQRAAEATGISVKDCKNYIYHLHGRGFVAPTEEYEVRGGKRNRVWQLGRIDPKNVRYVASTYCKV